MHFVTGCDQRARTVLTGKVSQVVGYGHVELTHTLITARWEKVYLAAGLFLGAMALLLASPTGTGAVKTAM